MAQFSLTPSDYASYFEVETVVNKGWRFTPNIGVIGPRFRSHHPKLTQLLKIISFELN